MPISFDIPGMQQLDNTTWGNPATRDVVALTYVNGTPDLPARLHDLPRLRKRLAEHHARTGCLIEAFVVWVDQLPALLRVEKTRMPGSPVGLVFAASIVVPKDRCSAVFQIICPETGAPGVREAVIGSRVSPAEMYPAHPYAPGLRGRLPYSLSDDIRFDEVFPEHPLTRARRWIADTVPKVRVDPAFAALPEF
ncbi:hypothetical protein [Nocardia rhizosphaerihabitans]|uniref:Uncharacterized protein n=1 Tax=Nocardia rhizosphaerihabitans TaxID=1691570 RepID=A0ABQ2KY76_9NOCA|nr:hypothetical protein [Nocardia rhizosphaerihabitans]GGN96721.1 hypothetical protein GCM10011610_61870 [Nocardia rhizosphaerihabitans]